MRLMERDGYILAISTGVLYLMAYFTILAKANFYDIPLEMLNFDFFQLTHAAISIFLFLLVLVASLLVVYWLLTAKSKKSMFLHFVLMVFSLPLWCFFSLRDTNETAAYSMAIFFSAMFVMFFVLTNKFRKIDAVSAFIDSDYKAFFSLFRVKIILFVLLFFVLMFSSYATSYVSAKYNNNYDVFTKEEYYALINTSTDIVVVKKVINKELSDGFYIFKIEDLTDVEVRNRDIRELPRNDSMQPIQLPAGLL